jgi:C-terminal processing protease CtpA/Prc
VIVSVALLSIVLLGAPSKTYAKDVDFALKALEKECGHFFKPKGIAWGKVRKQFKKEARTVKTDADHWLLLWRLICRLRDGHAGVLQTDRTKGLKWPDNSLEAGVAMELYSPDGKTFFVLRAGGDAAKGGVKPGMKVLKIDKQPPAKWMAQRGKELADTVPLYTPQQSRAFLCTVGLWGQDGSRLKLELKGKKITLGRRRKQRAPRGPVVPIPGLKQKGRVWYGTLPSGHGYVYLPKVDLALPSSMDTVLAALAEAPGIILDFRGNSGGGCNHDEFMGRFVPKGKTITFGKRYASAGTHPYAGPVVVIVDAHAKSSGETLSGIFKEDGRGYMIGPSATAGMSGSKKRIELPSGLFTLYVTVHSNKARFNRGKGVEGVGVPPHEIVPYDPEDLAEGVDTQIKRAVELLGKPLKGVPYRPR